MKCYFVTENKTSKPIGRYKRARDILFLLNAQKINEEYLVSECNRSDHSFEKLIQNGEEKWMTVGDLLFETYKDYPTVSIVVKDLATEKTLVSERYYSNDGPYSVALIVLENYFDQHYKEFKRGAQKDYLVYFKSINCPPCAMTVKLIVEETTTYKGVIGSDEPPFEETFPYSFEQSEAHEVESPVEFAELKSKEPKYEPTIWEHSGLY